jgi:hypothetical protein
MTAARKSSDSQKARKKDSAQTKTTVAGTHWTARQKLRILNGMLALVLFCAPCFSNVQKAAANAADNQPLDAEISYDQHRIFEFHNGFWVNLHHFLYEEAAVRAKNVRIRPESAEDADVQTHLSADEQQGWNDAVSYYQTKLVHRDLLFDDGMLAIKDDLEELENKATLKGSDLDPALVAILEKAAPIYRAHWWPEHQLQNRRWIETELPLVSKYGQILAQEIAAAYETQWPDSPVRVDVCAYSNWAGAYTSLRPTRVTTSSLDQAEQKTAGLEILFHESSHALIQKVSDSIDRETQTLQRKLPQPTLWHAVLFFTAGYEVQQLVSDYTPYADANGLWTRAWPTYRSPIVRDWQPHLEGKTTLEEAISRLVADAAVNGSDAPTSVHQ